MADQSTIEFYKLAAQIIPVLWLGTALQRLDPRPIRKRLRRLEDEKRPQPTPPGKENDFAAGIDEFGRQFGAHFAYGLELTFLRPTAFSALVALPLAACSEGLALYGVAADRAAAWMTTVIVAGLGLGGAVLLVPLVVGWLELARLSDD